MTVSTRDGKGDKQTIASDFRESVKGKLADEKIDAAVRALHAVTISYPVTITFSSAPFYGTIGVAVQGGKRFRGTFGDAKKPGMAGVTAGELYTDNLDLLYSDTRSFELLITPVYLSLLFFSGNFDLLGHVEAGAVSIVTGIGGGSGRWY